MHILSTITWPLKPARISTDAQGINLPPRVDTGGSASVLERGSSRRLVLLAYQDRAHERLGKTYWENLSARLGWEVDTCFTEWKFEMLAHPALARMAAEEAKAACLVVIATDCVGPLPAAVRAWIESWSTLPSAERCVLAIVMSENAAYPATQWAEYVFLQHQADQCNRRLVLYSSGRPAGEEGTFSQTDARMIGQRSVERVEDFVELAVLADLC